MKSKRTRAEKGVGKTRLNPPKVEPTVERVAEKKTQLQLANEALGLKINGASLEAIAQRLNLPSRMQSWRLIQYALAEIPRAKAEEYRAIEEAKMDADEVRLNVELSRATDPKDIARLIDTKQKIRTARARLNGLNRPEQLEVSFRADATMLDHLSPEDLRRVASFDFSPILGAGASSAGSNGAPPAEGDRAEESGPGGTDQAH